MLVMILVSPSYSMNPGISGSEPVARIRYSEVKVLPSTLTVWASTREPAPFITVTLLPLSSAPTPPVSCLTTAFFRAWSFSMETETAAGSTPSMPNSAAFFTSENTWTDLTSALVGMQPTLRQVPPRCSFSTRTVFFPACAALIAAT